MNVSNKLTKKIICKNNNVSSNNNLFFVNFRRNYCFSKLTRLETEKNSSNTASTLISISR